MLAGDHPSADFAISEQARFRRFVHPQMGMEIVTIGLLRDPVAVPSASRSSRSPGLSFLPLCVTCCRR